MKKPILKATPLYLLFLLSYPANKLLAQTYFGAKLTALGMNSAAVKDIWSIEGNMAGISGVKSPQLAICYTKYPSDVEWSNEALAFVLPSKNNFFGINMQRTGINEYNIIKAGATFAKNFGSDFTLAVKVNYHQLHINNYGSSTSFSFDVGTIYNFNEQFTFGVYVNNPSFQKFNNKNIQIEIPTIVYIGASYQISDKVLMATTINKNLTGAFDVGFGIDYQLLKQFNFRGGLTTHPFKEYVGFGLGYKNSSLDFALTSDPNLGLTPQISLAYAF